MDSWTTMSQGYKTKWIAAWTQLRNIRNANQCLLKSDQRDRATRLASTHEHPMAQPISTTEEHPMAQPVSNTVPMAQPISNTVPSGTSMMN